MAIKEYQNVIFDTEQKTFTILNGTKGTYSYKEIVKCEILGEAASKRGKTPPFEHRILIGLTFNQNPFVDKPFYLGVKLVMQDGQILAIYMSDQKTTTNTDVYFRDYENAKKIKKIVKHAIEKY